MNVENDLKKNAHQPKLRGEDSKHTKSDIFSKVMMTYVVVKGLVTRTWTHFFRAIRDAIQFGPAALDPFTVGPSPTILEVQ